MCSLHSKLTARHEAAVSAYREAVARMKVARGLDFERASRFAEDRRTLVKVAWRALTDHERDHFCAA
jgi:hypothetical protein